MIILIIFIHKTLAWESVKVNSELPTPRSGHSMTTYEGELYLFGGCELDIKCNNDLLKYNAGTSIWETLETQGAKPEGREGHSATLVGNKLYVFGGSSLGKLLEDVFVLDLDTLTWEAKNLAGEAEPRAYHSAAIHDAGIVVIFGGYTQAGLTNEVLLLDTVNAHWGHPTTIGNIPSPRKHHSFNRVGKLLYAFGGETTEGVSKELFSLDMHKKRWEKVESEGGPLNRHGHSTCAHGDFIYLSGGCNSQTHYCYDDLYTFDYKLKTWKKLQVGGYKARESHAMDFIGGDLYLFGGRFFMEKLYGDFKVFSTNITCPNNCSNKGSCTEYGCECDPGWFSSDCSIETKCKMNCNNHGLCEDYYCKCFPGYYGDYCQGIIDCKNNCTAGVQGECQDSGECLCFDGYYGEDCALKEPWVICQENCLNGECENSGVCNCFQGWVGVDCDVEAPVVYTYKTTEPTQEINVSVSSEAEFEEPESKESGNEGTQETQGTQENQDSYEEDNIVYAEDVSVEDEYYNRTVSSQDKSSELVSFENSTHVILPQMFGLSDSENPLSYSENNLRENSQEPEPEDWVVYLEDKQESRLDDIESCSNKCNFNGVCYDGKCYCSEGYTGENCERDEDSLEDGVKLSDLMIIAFVCFLVGVLIGGYQLRKILREVNLREESRVNEED